MEIKILKKLNYLTLILNSLGGRIPNLGDDSTRPHDYKNHGNNSDNYLFRNFWAKIDGKITDIADNGSNSCALLVSWIIIMADGASHQWLKSPHAVTESLVKDLESCGWQAIDPSQLGEGKMGAIIVWEKLPGLRDQKMHGHIGFFLEGNAKEGYAVSNDSRGLGFPHKHHITYGYKPDSSPVRAIEKVLWHPDLDKEE